MAIKFDISGDNRNLLAALEGARASVRDTAREMEQSGMSIKQFFNGIASAATFTIGVEGINSLTGFFDKIKETRAYFQDIESSMEVFLGNKAQADKFTQELKDYAYYNMFEFSDLADASKQMIAYGHNVEDVIPALDKLSNIATGTKADLGEMVSLYNRAKSTGGVDSNGLQSWAVRGVVVKDVLKEMGESVDDGRVSFEQLNKVLDKVTGEGGMFHKLMLNQMENISAEEGQFEDNLASMYNELGEHWQDLITKSVKVRSWAVEHYETIGKALLTLIQTYGVYRATLIATNKIEKAKENVVNNIESTRQGQLSSVVKEYEDDSDIVNYGEDVSAEEASTQATLQNTAARDGNRAAIDEQIAALERKMIASVEEYEKEEAAAAIAVEAAKKKEESEDSTIETIQEQIEKQQELVDSCQSDLEAAISLGDAKEIEAGKELLDAESKELSTLQSKLSEAQTNKQAVSETRLAAEKNLATASTKKEMATEKLNNFQKAASTVQTNAQTAATGFYAAVVNTATKALQGLKAAFMSNPWGIAITAITTLLTMTSLFKSENEEISEDCERFGESAVQSLQNVETLFAVIENTNSDSNVHKDAIEELCDIYEEYGIHIDEEKDKVEQLRDAHLQLTAAIKDEGRERQKANAIEEYKEDIEEEQKTLQDSLKEALEDVHWDRKGIIENEGIISAFKEQAGDLSSHLATIIGSDLQNLLSLPEDEIDAKIKEYEKKLENLYDAFNLDTTLKFRSGPNETEEVKMVVDVAEAIRKYISGVQDLKKKNTILIESLDSIALEAPKIEKVAEKVDYSTMSIQDLASAAWEASGAVSDVGDQNAEPTVDDSSITNATEKAETAESTLSGLNQITSLPTVWVQGLDESMQKAYQLHSVLTSLSNFGQGKTGAFGITPASGSLTQPITPFNFSNARNGLGFAGGANFGLSSSPRFGSVQNAREQQKNAQNEALAELNNRVDKANTNKKVSYMLKDVNEALDNAEFGSEQYNQLKKIKERLEKKSGKGGKNKTKKNSGKNGKTTAEKVAEEEEKLADMEDELALKRIRSAQDLESELTKARLEVEEDGAEKIRLQQEQENKEEIDSLVRQKEDAIQQYIDEERKIFEQKEKIKKTQNEKYKEKKFDEKSVDTSGLEKKYDKQILLTRQRQERDANIESVKAMRDYLKEYGSYEEQKLAITQEYEEKIRQAKTEGEKLSLQEEQQGQLDELEISAIQQKIDWYSIFDNVGLIMKSQLEPMLASLKQFANSEKFSELDASNQQTIVDAINNIRSTIGTTGDVGWQDLAAAITAYQQALRENADAQTRYSEAAKELAEAQANLEKAKSGGDKTAIDNAQQTVDEFSAKVRSCGEDIVSAEGKIKASGIKLSSTAKDVIKPVSAITTFLGSAGLSELQSLFSAIDELKGGIEGLTALKELGKATTDVAEAVGDASDALGDTPNEVAEAAGEVGDALATGLSKAGLIGQIIAAIMKILDVLKDGIGPLITSILDTIFEAISGLLENILSGEFVKQIFSSLMNGIGGVFESLIGGLAKGATFGLISDGPSDWFKNSNAERVAEVTEELTKVNEDLADRISDLKDVIGDSAGDKALSAYELALEAQEEVNANAMEILKTQMGYHSSHHSNAYYAEDKEIAAFNAAAQAAFKAANVDAVDITGLESIYNLSPEQLKAIKDFAPGLWEYLTTVGEYDKTEYWDNVIEQAGKLEELTDTINENLTQTSFSSMRDSFRSALTDMESDADDFAKDFESLLFEAIVNTFILDDSFDEWLQGFYDKWAEKMKSGTMTRSDWDAFNKEYTDKYNEKVAERNAWADALDYTGDSTYEQEASSKGFQSMGQDTAEELNGRFTAMQIACENVGTQAVAILGKMSEMAVVQTNNNAYLMEIRNMLISTNSYLDDVAKYSKKIYMDFSDKLDTVISNTKNL